MPFNNTASYPGAIWTGSSPVRQDLTVNRGPDTEDWEQIVAELIATQTDLYNLKYWSTTNKNASTMIPGCPVYALAAGTGVDRADANGTAPLPYVVGLNTASAVTDGAAIIQKAGRLTLTTAEWDAAAGTTGGLVAGKEYYLSGTVGVITSTVPATTGDHIVSIGIAISTTVLDINVKYRRISP